MAAECGATPEAILEPIIRKRYQALGLLDREPRCWLPVGHPDRHRFRTASDHPIDDVAKTVYDLFKGPDGPIIQVFQKFTCEWCGARQSMDVPNKLYTQGTCDECKKLTEITEAGCNFWMVKDLRLGVTGTN